MRTFTANVDGHAIETKAARQTGRRQRQGFQTKQPATASAAQMRMPLMLAIRLCRRKPEHPLPVRRLVRESGIGEPVEHTVNGNAINRALDLLQSSFNFSMAQRRRRAFEQRQNTHTRKSRPPASIVDGFSERRGCFRERHAADFNATVLQVQIVTQTGRVQRNLSR